MPEAGRLPRPRLSAAALRAGRDADDEGVALTAAAAEGGRADAAAAPLQLSSARCRTMRAPDIPIGWPSGDGAAVDVDDVLVDAEVAGGRDARRRRTPR